MPDDQIRSGILYAKNKSKRWVTRVAECTLDLAAQEPLRDYDYFIEKESR